MARREKERNDPDLESIELELFLIALLRKYGYDFRDYERGYVRKQALRRMDEEDLSSLSRLSESILRDREVFERFLGQFAKARDSLFHPASFWRSFRERVVPFLRTYPSLRLWLAGGSPEDLYTLSILLEESVPRNVQIYATDIHELLLTAARSGDLESRKVTEGVREYRSSGGQKSLNHYFEKTNGSSRLSASLKKKIVFAAHNPVTDGTFQECHVILARNLLQPLEPELSVRTYRLLHSSLIPLGFLALGPKDNFQESPLRTLYKEVDWAARLYQKIRE
jgi:chemotaxis protein methyltransferase CheR